MNRIESDDYKMFFLQHQVRADELYSNGSGLPFAINHRGDMKRRKTMACNINTIRHWEGLMKRIKIKARNCTAIDHTKYMMNFAKYIENNKVFADDMESMYSRNKGVYYVDNITEHDHQMLLEGFEYIHSLLAMEMAIQQAILTAELIQLEDVYEVIPRKAVDIAITPNLSYDLEEIYTRLARSKKLTYKGSTDRLHSLSNVFLHKDFDTAKAEQSKAFSEYATTINGLRENYGPASIHLANVLGNKLRKTTRTLRKVMEY